MLVTDEQPSDHHQHVNNQSFDTLQNFRQS